MSDTKNIASMIDVLKLKASKYYQDEMEAKIGGKLFVEERELKEFHKNINININTKYRDEFNMLNQYTYAQTVRDCIKVVFDKVVKNNSLYRPKDTHAIGIDLGTTNSCVSYFKPSAENKFNCVVVPNELGRHTTASVVSIREDEEVVGDVAKEEIYVYPKNTIISAKRLIGRRFKDESVQKSRELWSYDVIDEENNPKIKIEVDAEERVYYPEQISAKILKKMRESAEKHLSCKVNKAVITVPAYFSNAQKQATKDAAEIAGLEVLRIINEPTAAAIAFRLNWTYQTKPRNVLIYDFGGGTFDVAILVISEGEIDVKAVGGDNHLGGDDFDTNIIKYCLEDFNKKYKTKVTGDEGERALSRLRLEAEKCKIKLSAVKNTKINLLHFHDSHDMSVVLTREIFENLNKDLIEKSMNLVLKTLKEAALTTNDIDDIVLVGGSTRIPKIQDRLSEIFGGRSLNHTINPDEAVAVGAAIHAAMLNDKKSVPLGNFVLRDVNPHSLGIAIKDHRFHPIIRKNTKIPTKQTQEMTTTLDNQQFITMDIYEGEGEFIKDNNLLGKFSVTDVPSDKLGAQKVHVTFELTDEGILFVKAEVISTGQVFDTSIMFEKSGLNSTQLEKLIEEVIL